MPSTNEQYQQVVLKRLEFPRTAHRAGEIVTIGRLHDTRGQQLDPSRDSVVGPARVTFVARTTSADYYVRPAERLRTPNTKARVAAGVVINLSKVRSGEFSPREIIAGMLGDETDTLTIGQPNPWGNKGKIEAVVGIYPEDLLIDPPADTSDLPSLDWLQTAERVMGRCGQEPSVFALGTRCLDQVLQDYEAQTC